MRPAVQSPHSQSGSVGEPYAIGLLRSMLEIPSPSYEEARLAAHVASIMGQLGFTVQVDTAGNAMGELVRGEGPTVMLAGHLDTVPGEIEVRAEDNRLYGRGAVDAKSPLAAMICAAYNADRFRGRLIVVGAVEEETSQSRGAVLIRETHERPDALIVGEPSGWDTVVVGYKGKLDLHYSVERPATHPSNPEPKASELAAESWLALLEVLRPARGHTSFSTPGPTLVSISGNLVFAEAELSIRTPLGYECAALVTALRERTPLGSLEVVNSVAACRVSRANPVVRALASGIRGHAVGPAFKAKSGTSDMNIFAEVWDVPMATYGPGDSRLDHGADEHVLISDYLRSINVLSDALGRLPGYLGVGG